MGPKCRANAPRHGRPSTRRAPDHIDGIDTRHAGAALPKRRASDDHAPALTAGGELMRSFAIAAVVLLASIGTAEAAPGDDVYAHPGRIVSAGDGARLNLVCMGHGSPAVVFDSGWEDWAPVWTIVQPQVAKWTRACSYDRAGAGFSEAGPMPRTSARIATELHTALHNAGIAGPYILVGHAFGGDNVRTFADLYMDEVAGLVLDDSDATDLEPKENQEE